MLPHNSPGGSLCHRLSVIGKRPIFTETGWPMSGLIDIVPFTYSLEKPIHVYYLTCMYILSVLHTKNSLRGNLNSNGLISFCNSSSILKQRQLRRLKATVKCRKIIFEVELKTMNQEKTSTARFSLDSKENLY